MDRKFPRRRIKTLRRLRQKAYDSALNKASSESAPPMVRLLPSPAAVVALVIALIVAVVFSLLRLNASSSEVILEGGAESVSEKLAEQSGSDSKAGGSEQLDRASDGPGSSDSAGGIGDGNGGPGGSAANGAGTIVVQVTGAVKNPSVVTVPAGARGLDAVEAAGGLNDDASLSSVNLAQPIVDGQHIHVLTQAEVDVGHVPDSQNSAGGGGNTTGSSVPGQSGCVDLRTADQTSLQTLPGVGPALAERIDAYRSENGLQNPEDVLNVPGIGPKTFAGFKDMLCP